MAREDDDTRPIGLHRVEVCMTEAQRQLLQRAAQAAGAKTVEVWAQKALLAAALRVVSNTR